MLNMNKTKPTISDKAKIREEVKKSIVLLNERDKNKAAQAISTKIIGLSIFQKSTTIILYEGLHDEIDLEYVLQEALKQGKNIITITPSGSYLKLPHEWIILVPGRAFTLSGKRVGRGGGWYDRLLWKHTTLYTIGICFDCQIFPDLPQDEWDIPMNTIITW
jgi:5-formyltetrahydrofolate cyclo-ligase